jgi:hypothetical protein
MAMFMITFGLNPEQYRNLTLFEREALIEAYKESHQGR